MKTTRTLLLSILFVTTATLRPQSSVQVPARDWHAKLAQQLPLLGHRNWILIVDSAYPLQVSPGVEVVETGADQLAVVSTVLNALDHSIHVSPNIYLDAELPFVPQQNFPSLNAYRANLKKTLQGRPVQSLPHEQLIARVSEAGKDFRILVLKTNMAMPYTSVFLQLDCKYWGAEDEQKLRQTMKASPSK
jgi:D-ribose pyranose/furanose isomerase RbsD